MKKTLVLLALVLLASLVIGGCTPAAPAPAPSQTSPAPAATPASTGVAEQPAAPTVSLTAQSPSAQQTVVVGSMAAPSGVKAPKTLRLPDLKGRKITAVTANDYTPLNFVDPKTGKPMGWEYDAVNEMCRRLNCTVDWQVGSWDTMIAAINKGQFDIGMDGISITDERKKQVDFSAPYMISQQYMLVRANEDRFQDPQSFAANPKLLIGSQAGTTNFYVAVNEVLDGKEDNPRIKLFDNFGAAVQALIAGDVDMVLMDRASSKGYVGANPDKLKVIGDPLGTDQFGFIFPPKSDLVAPFDAVINQMWTDSFLEYLNNRWFYLTDPNGKDTYDQLPDLKGRKIKAVAANDYTPLNFVDPKTGKAVGWEYEAVNEICRRINCTVDWQTGSWDAMITAINKGQFDVGMDGISITDERKKQVDFSDPYMDSSQFMLVRANENRFNDAKSFAADPELLIGSQAGTTNFYVAVNQVLDGKEDNPRIKLFENFGAAVQALISGDVDMVLMDQASSRGYIGANPEKLKTVGDPLGSDQFGFIFTPKSDLVQPFNAALASMKQDGYEDYLNMRWFYLYDGSAK
jgi:ABC-type amino acid transport substrate-binding protein